MAALSETCLAGACPPVGLWLESLEEGFVRDSFILLAVTGSEDTHSPKFCWDDVHFLRKFLARC